MTSLKLAESALGEAELARREVARRLASAQDDERTRIARELHDDIGQSSAILGMQMMRAGRPVSNLPGKRHPSVAELCDDLRTIAVKVSRISHQLHPAKLEYLGLAVAVRAHCREFSEKYRIGVECSCDDIPKDLNALIGMSFLRAAQEALHNVGKHSGATAVQVNLRGSTTELSLVVADNGTGFDLETARLAAGLGLISMRERTYLAGGEFTVVSKPGAGTTVTARVPLVDGRTAAPSEPA
jgi:signal transduction histidine kinase